MGQKKSKVSKSEIDADGDGNITMEEVQQYVNMKLASVEEENRVLLRIKEKEIEDLEEKCKILKRALEEQEMAYEDLHGKHSEVLDQLLNEAYKQEDFLETTSGVSPEVIENVVEEILKDPNINLKKVPDFLERKVYYNVIWITLIAVEKIMHSIKIDALGHEFKLVMSPIKN
jgi:glutamyl-tRNA reductase